MRKVKRSTFKKRINTSKINPNHMFGYAPRSKYDIVAMGLTRISPRLHAGV